MTEVYLNQLSKVHAEWLSVRQSTLAGNVANANTPGYQAKEVSAFEPAKPDFARMVVTSPMHATGGSSMSGDFRIERQQAWDVYHSGGNVNLSQEMMKAGEVATDFELNTNVMRSFHRMLISVFGS